MLGRPSVHDNPLIARLVEFGLERDDFVLFGSAPLLAHGLRQDIRDLDVVARGRAWRHVSSIGIPGVGVVSGDRVVQFWGGRIQFSSGWIAPTCDADELIDNADVVEGLRFASLSNVLAYKRALGRRKDLADIRKILAATGPPPHVPTSPEPDTGRPASTTA
ncbi:hypothetical protein [Umezawaea sp. Da 62-37]|uniref:hypothetical protein n=1 Tax=Umezawaea sp. Da 62-37 TaxID=3075927 RepID=UPI0028F6CC30|nr:hypothetical protein [Umezawaea sp. Da 62-37]WNV86454.1 hypothetical protein RM788_51480 [Umezawaea sp. Da 62-37]